jgi:hypothetical protein
VRCLYRLIDNKASEKLSPPTSRYVRRTSGRLDRKFVKERTSFEFKFAFLLVDFFVSSTASLVLIVVGVSVLI